MMDGHCLKFRNERFWKVVLHELSDQQMSPSPFAKLLQSIFHLLSVIYNYNSYYREGTAACFWNNNNNN